MQTPKEKISALLKSGILPLLIGSFSSGA